MDDKQLIAKYIVNMLPKSGIIGLGAGSTVNIIIEQLANTSQSFEFVSASSSTSIKLSEMGLKEISILSVKKIKYTIDGADNLIHKNSNKLYLKGLGGSPSSEKILWNFSDKIIIGMNESKMKIPEYLTVPIEIIPFAYKVVTKQLQYFKFSKFNLRKTPRMEMPFITDLGNYIIDLQIHSTFTDFSNLHTKLKSITGIVDTGIFNNYSNKSIIISNQGKNILII